MATFKIFQDAGLTTEFAGPIINTQNADGTTPDQDYTFYIGSTDVGKTMRTKINPGVDDILLTITDTTPANGPEAVDVKLATTLIGLDSAVGGASLNLGSSILSEVVNAVQFFVRIAGPAIASGTYNQLIIIDNGTEEV